MRNYINRCFIIFLLCIYTLSPMPISAISAVTLESDNDDDMHIEAVSSGEELMSWLDDNQKGSVQLTADIVIEDFIYSHLSKEPLKIDTGEFSITFTGKVIIQTFGGITIVGSSTQDGILRVAEGGCLSLIDSPANPQGIIVDCKTGISIYQEEGAGLYTEGNVVATDIHFAKTPFIMYWTSYEDTVIALKEQNASDVLPAEFHGKVVSNGYVVDQDVEIIWNLDSHEESEADRLRFNVTGSISGYGYGNNIVPVCTVVYDDHPITFTGITAEKTPRNYVLLHCKFINHAPPNTVITPEYSFDGETWEVFEYQEIISDTRLVYIFNASDASDDHCITWDTSVNPNIYISLSYTDGERNQYSNTIQFSYENLDEVNDSGGSRGGGEDIIPPIDPAPEPDPEPEPDSKPIPEPKPESKPIPEPEPESKPIPEPEPDSKPIPEPEPDSKPIPEPEPDSKPIPEPKPDSKPIPEPKPDSKPIPKPEPDSKLIPKPESKPEPEPELILTLKPIPITEQDIVTDQENLLEIVVIIVSLTVSMGIATIFFNKTIRKK